MDIGSLFLILALLVLVALFVSRPFFEHKMTRLSVSQEEHDISGLLAERDRILNALQELDFDYALRKIPEEDYPAQRAYLLQRGADVLRKLDQMQAITAGEDAEARLEAAVAARRADARQASANARSQRGVMEAAAQVSVPDDELETILADRRRVRQEKAVGFCPQCGGPIHRSDRFCPKCGTTLA